MSHASPGRKTIAPKVIIDPHYAPGNWIVDGGWHAPREIIEEWLQYHDNGVPAGQAYRAKRVAEELAKILRKAIASKEARPKLRLNAPKRRQPLVNGVLQQAIAMEVMRLMRYHELTEAAAQQLVANNLPLHLKLEDPLPHVQKAYSRWKKSLLDGWGVDLIEQHQQNLKAMRRIP